MIGFGEREAAALAKLKVYKAAVLSSLLYACETRSVFERHIQEINQFYHDCLRKQLKITWGDKVPATDSMAN